MPRRDLVLTGLIAFGVGVAVGANWGKLRKKVGPMLEKFGLRMADFGDALSADGMEDFVAEAMNPEANVKRPRRAKAREFAATRRKAPKRKPSRRKSAVIPEEEEPLATGTFGK